MRNARAYTKCAQSEGDFIKKKKKNDTHHFKVKIVNLLTVNNEKKNQGQFVIFW